MSLRLVPLVSAGLILFEWPASAQTNGPPVWASLGPHPVVGKGAGNFSAHEAPPPYAGRVTAIAPDPNDPKVAYIGGADGGVWRTTDDGITWTPLFDEQPSLSIGAIAVDPTNSAVVYVGTGEGSYTGDSYPGAGIFRSGDGGVTWTKVGGDGFDDCHIPSLAIDPAAPSTLLAAAADHAAQPGPGHCAGKAGVYRSVDSGATWSRVLAATPSDLVFDPADPSTGYAGVVGPDPPLWRSTDGGATWGPVEGHGLPKASGRVSISVLGGWIGIVASDPFEYKGTSLVPSADFQGVWASHDGGSSWVSPITQFIFEHVFCGFYQPDIPAQCPYDLAIAADPSEPGSFFVGGRSLFQVDHDGLVMHRIGLDITGDSQLFADYHALAFDALGRLWAGNDGGVYRSADQGATWTNLNQDLAITQFYCCASGLVDGVYIAGAQDQGFDEYSGEAAWTKLFTGDGGPVAIDPSNPNTIYISDFPDGIYKSTDGGTTWTRKDTEEMRSGGELDFAIVMDPTNPNRLYAGIDRVWRSDDGADTWTALGDPLQGGKGTLIAMAVGKSDPDSIYAVSYDFAAKTLDVEVSTDAGATWTSRTKTLPEERVRGLAIDPKDAAHALIGLAGYGHGHVFETEDAGATWTDVSGDLPDTPARALVIDPSASPTTLIAGTESGVFWSGEGSGHWERLGTGLPNSVVVDLSFDPASRLLIAATHGRGAWSLTVPTLFVPHSISSPSSPSPSPPLAGTAIQPASPGKSGSPVIWLIVGLFAFLLLAAAFVFRHRASSRR